MVSGGLKGGAAVRDISLHVLDIAQNSIRAGAKKVSIRVDESPDDDLFSLTVSDDGCGMTAEMLGRVRDPFFTTRRERSVGLGIPLLAARCEACGGSFSIESQPGRGTVVTARMQLSHIDRPPLGDIIGTVLSLIALNPGLVLAFQHRVGEREYGISTEDIRRVLGDDVSLGNPAVVGFLREYLDSRERWLRCSSTE